MPYISGSLAISGSLILFDGRDTVSITATGSSANFTSSFATTASYAVSSGCTNKVNIFSTASGDTNMFVTLVPDLSTGCQYTYVDQQLRYDAVSNLLYATSEYAINATSATSSSYALNATSASNARTASVATSAITANTASYVLNAVSSSYATTADNINISSSNFTDTIVSLVMVPNQTTGSQPAIIDAKLLFNTVGNILTTDNIEVSSNITSSGDLRFTTAGNAVVRPIIDLVPNGTASYNPNITNTTAYANYGINLITTASLQSNCFRLPQTPVKGKTVTVINNSGINVIVFPSVAGGEVNGIINGYAILPSDGKSYSFDCYENPLPGGWSLSNSPTPGNTSISTGEINWAYISSSSQIITYVNDSIKATGGGISAYPPNLGPYITNQYQAGNYVWSSGGNSYTYTFSQYLPDTIPGQGVWKSIDSLQIQTNITGALANSFDFSYSQGNNNELFYSPNNPNYDPNDIIPPWSIYQSPSYLSFNANVRNPWFASRPGTQGNFNGSGGGGVAPSTTSIVPGTFTPSLASPYTSDNIGDPGTLILTINNFPAYLNSVGLRWVGRNFIGTFYHPSFGLIDSWYTQTFSPFFMAVVGTPFIPNIKFNTIFNVQI